MSPNKTIALLLLSIIISSCASKGEPTFGEHLQNQGTETKRIGKNWTKGDVMITEGKELVAEGETLISKGRSMTSKGEEKVSQGNKMIRTGQELRYDAEGAYQKRK